MWLNFCALLIQIGEKSLDEIIMYAETKIELIDVIMAKLQISHTQLSVRLILNTDGANVCKSSATSAWPLFIAVADLPLKKTSF